MSSSAGYDPYNPPYGDITPPWITILGFDSYLINPDIQEPSGKTDWYGLWQNYSDGTSTAGSGNFLMSEQGAINEFNIALGGNIANVLYWGMNFDIININYSLYSIWGENLSNALWADEDLNFFRSNAKWNMRNGYSVSGTGFNYQLGFIVKPIQELRLGFAFHTPTWYNLNETYDATVNFQYGDKPWDFATTNGGVPGYNSMGLRTPWKIIASAAAVLGRNFILSFDYEWANYGAARFTEPSVYSGDYYYDYDWDPWAPYALAANPGTRGSFINPSDPYYDSNLDITNYFKSSNTIRIGAEFKPFDNFSIRAGYSFVSSPVQTQVKNNDVTVATAGTMPSYRIDNNTNYITCGLGYRYKRFYADLAYVYKLMSSEYHAYTPDPISQGGQGIPSPQAKVNFTNNQIVFSAGFRF